MASVAENLTYGMNVVRLRNAGRVAPVGDYGGHLLRPPPPSDPTTPIAVATGSASIIGPQAGAVSTNAYWNVGLPMPDDDSVQWVMVSSRVAAFGLVGFNSMPVSIVVWPIGDATANDAVRGPAFGPGTDLVETSAPAVTRGFALAPNDSGVQQVWQPLDPERTKGGFYLQLSMQIGVTGCAQNALRLDCLGIRLLGFPIEAQATAGLWDGASVRGS